MRSEGDNYPERRPDDGFLMRTSSEPSGSPDEVIGVAVEHSIEDPFTGEITVQIAI